MATKPSTSTPTGNSSSFVATWAGLAANDDGAAIKFAQFTDKSVQVSGVFGGASVRLAGSNDGVSYLPLTDPQGNALDIATAKIKAVTEATFWVKPIVTGGDGTTMLDVSVLLKE